MQLIMMLKVLGPEAIRKEHLACEKPVELGIDNAELLYTEEIHSSIAE